MNATANTTNVSLKRNKPKGFVRSFDISKTYKLTDKDADLFARLKADIYAGSVFPTVRKDEIHFYHAGGCLYKLKGTSFIRDSAYEKYSLNTDRMNSYDKAKKQNQNRYSNAVGIAKERQLLDRLNSNTFNPNFRSRVVVLDVEVRLNGAIGVDKKCDLVLLNTETRQIMFVEGKVFKDKRVNVAVGFVPEVIEQVKTYTMGINEQADVIETQYAQHIRIINDLFQTKYNLLNRLVSTAKLLVYEKPEKPNSNGQYSINTINMALGSKNVMWVPAGNQPRVEEIWDALC